MSLTYPADSKGLEVGRSHFLGTSVMVQWGQAKACGTSIPYARRQSPNSSTSTTLPCNTPGKAAEGGPSIWTPATCIEYLDGVLSSWLGPSLVLAITVIWEVNL